MPASPAPSGTKLTITAGILMVPVSAITTYVAQKENGVTDVCACHSQPIEKKP